MKLLNRKGQVQRQAPVQMVDADATEWSAGKVDIQLIADWGLPLERSARLKWA